MEKQVKEELVKLLLDGKDELKNQKLSGKSENLRKYKNIVAVVGEHEKIIKNERKHCKNHIQTSLHIPKVQRIK